MKLTSLKINGKNYPYNESENLVNYEGEWREVQTDQEGDLYIYHNGAMYLDDLHQPQDESQKELFTGGEWKVYCNANEYDISSFDEYHLSGSNIAYVNSDNNRDEDEAKANATLIAASPDMYRALKEVALIISSLINKTPTGKERNYLCDLNIKLLSAINKANNRNENNT